MVRTSLLDAGARELRLLLRRHRRDRASRWCRRSESIPSFIGTLPETVKHFLRFFPPDKLEPGDVLITNDIWLGTGHLPDITLGQADLPATAS